jgi:hypothetical protein
MRSEEWCLRAQVRGHPWDVNVIVLTAYAMRLRVDDEGQCAHSIRKRLPSPPMT